MVKITELNSSNPRVGDVITRLNVHQDSIQSITCVIEWDDETFDVIHDEKELLDLVFESQVLQKYAMGKIKINSEE